MSKWHKIAFSLYLIVTAMLALRGVELVVSDFQPYQLRVLELPWQDISPPYQQLIHFLNAFAGSVMLVYCLCLMTLLCLPFRQGKRWARCAVPVLLLAYCLASLYAMLQVQESEPPINSVLGLMVMILIAIFVSLMPYRKTS